MAVTQAIPLGLAVTLVQNQTYALPARACVLTSSAAIETSLDGTTWNAHTSGQNTGAPFIRSTLANTIVTCKAIPASGSSGGSGSSLPTAPLGQVLISQGAGIPPVFSTVLNVNNVNGEFGIVSGQGAIRANQVQFNSAWPVSVIPAGTYLGDLVNFNDSTTKVPGAVVVGGGTFHVLARWNGTNWICIGG